MRLVHARKLTQAAVLIIYGIAFAGIFAWGVTVLRWLPRCSPLLAITERTAIRGFGVLFLPAALMVVLGLIWPRVFCGWLCPVGSLIDLADRAWGHGRKEKGKRKKEKGKRQRRGPGSYVGFTLHRRRYPGCGRPPHRRGVAGYRWGRGAREQPCRWASERAARIIGRKLQAAGQKPRGAESSTGPRSAGGHHHCGTGRHQSCGAA